MQKRHISLSINGLNKKREIRIVRANACPHYAIILALIAESTMNKGIGRRYESMRAKREIIPVGGLRKMNLGENYESKQI